MKYRDDRHRLLGMAAILVTLSISIPVSAAISKGGNYTNAVAAEQQRLLLFDEAERSHQKQLQVGRDRYEQKQTNRARVIAAMASELQARQQVVVIHPAAAETRADADQPLVPVQPSLALAVLAIALIGFGYYRNRQRARNVQRPAPPPLPELPPQVAELSMEDEIFYCKASGANGCGRYSPEGFLVIKGSIGRKRTAPFNATETSRSELLDGGVVREEGEKVIFEQDHLFPSPGGAATALLGRTANGWIEWKTADGKTLDMVQRLERKPLQ
ncbi:MAG: DUF4357 domain-containing protein [Limisphaerales bacterium]